MRTRIVLEVNSQPGDLIATKELVAMVLEDFFGHVRVISVEFDRKEVRNEGRRI